MCTHSTGHQSDTRGDSSFTRKEWDRWWVDDEIYWSVDADQTSALINPEMIHLWPQQESRYYHLWPAPTSSSSLTDWHQFPLVQLELSTIKTSLSICPNSSGGYSVSLCMSCDALSPSAASLMLQGLRAGLKHNYALPHSLQLCGKRRGGEGREEGMMQQD